MIETYAVGSGESPGGARDRLDAAFLRPDDAHGFLQVFANIGGHLGLLLVASRINQLWAIIPLVVLTGVSCHRLFFPLHDCLHRSLFRSRLVNSFFGHFLAGLIGTPYESFRKQHLAHHRNFGKPEDPGAEDYRVRFRSRQQLVSFLLAPLVGATFLSRLWGYARRFWRTSPASTASSMSLVALAKPSPQQSHNLQDMQELLIAVFIQVGVFALLTQLFELDQLWRYPVFGILPMATVFICLNRLRMFLEHASLDYTKTDYLTGLGRPIVRTIYATPLERLLICGGHFNYHHEHHLYPVVPGCNLPLLHREIKPTIDAEEIRQSYWQALADIWRHLGSGQVVHDGHGVN